MQQMETVESALAPSASDAVEASRAGERAIVRGIARYDGFARLLHWIFAVAILYATLAGYALAQLADGPLREFLSCLNMSIATVLIVLFPLRVWWACVRVAPRALHGVSATQRALAHGVHRLMYLTIFAVLASGYLMVPRGYSFFGLIEIPTPFEEGPLIGQLFAFHRASCAMLAGLVVLHVLAVVKHQWIARNNVLDRML
ncbi:MAG TPA: cytochrome b/b6 domain-containing protein [Paraburkholderia sp.]|jgi:cytochrome b561|uniref:cytochrome b n=1 Tax=Paraburkholderia sp. TaxID=1926495 RepID=UPI002DEDB502|nr:cytochrome b/b6 domain-containing protein [Paraburkholderia sp.]